MSFYLCNKVKNVSAKSEVVYQFPLESFVSSEVLFSGYFKSICTLERISLLFNGSLKNYDLHINKYKNPLRFTRILFVILMLYSQANQNIERKFDSKK